FESFAGFLALSQGLVQHLERLVHPSHFKVGFGKLRPQMLVVCDTGLVTIFNLRPPSLKSLARGAPVRLATHRDGSVPPQATSEIRFPQTTRRLRNNMRARFRARAYTELTTLSVAALNQR